MKFGVNTWVWVSPFGTEHMDLLEKARTMGFDSIEIAAENWELIDIPGLRARIRECELEVTVCGAFGPTRDLVSDDPDIREQAFRYIEQSIVNTERLGGSVFAGPLYSAVGKARLVAPDQRKAETDRFADAMARLVRMAADHGVTLGLEPLNRFETDFANTAAQAVGLVDLIGHPNLGVHLDTFHMGIEEKSMADAILLAGGRLKHFHACENDRGAPGSGLVPWETVRQALASIGYQGHMTIESFTPGVKEIARAAAIWRPLAASQDELAESGLRFLKSMFA